MKLFIAFIIGVHFTILSLPEGCFHGSEIHANNKSCCTNCENPLQCHSKNTIHKYCSCHCLNTSPNEETAEEVANILLKETSYTGRQNALIHNINSRSSERIMRFADMKLNRERRPPFKPLLI